MKIGLIPANVGVNKVEDMVGLAQYAESLGVESVWTFEHAIVPMDYNSKYPYSADGKMGTTPETNFIDPLIALAAIAASTKTVRLGTGVNILSQANPLMAAKQAASLDFVSNGRFMFGAGIGWLSEEFDAMGVPFERRGARFDDYVTAIRKVWSGDVVEHKSDFIDWSGFKSYPLPVQKPGIPIIIGGTKGKIYQRIAKHGDGWFIPSASVDEISAMLEPLEAACEKEGRNVADIEITAMWDNKGGLESVQALSEAGVSRLVVPLFALKGNPISGLTQLGEDIIAKL